MMTENLLLVAETDLKYASDNHCSARLPSWLCEELLSELARLREERRWIPVSTPPKDGQRVFILAKSGGVSNTVFMGGKFMWDEGIEYTEGAITGWFPIPQEREA